MFMGLSMGSNRPEPRVAKAPTVVTPITIAGLTPVGSTLTATPGTFSGYPTPTYTYQWYRAGALVPGEVGLTYLTTVTDQGQAITCVQTATSSSGTATSTSNAITVT